MKISVAPVIFFVVLLLSQACKSEYTKEKKEVYYTLIELFNAMNDDNGQRSSDYLMHDGQYHSLNMQSGEIRCVRFSTYIDRLSGNENIYRETLIEPIEITVRGEVATLIASYSFHINDTLSHIGNEVFSFVKHNGIWKITSSVYTVDKTNQIKCKIK